MKYSALIGKPTEHSVSPHMYEWLAGNIPDHLEYKHLKIDIDTPDLLKSALFSFQTLNFAGVNVTLPYKQAIMPYLDAVDDVAQKIGAVNTIRFDKETSEGFNTDWYGVYKPLFDILSGRTVDEAVIFGSGGAARAAIHACSELGVKNIVILHRPEEHTHTTSLKRQLNESPNITFDTYENVQKYFDTPSIVINATSAGMIGQDSSPFALELLDSYLDLSHKIYFDCVFNPIDTPLMQLFSSRGAKTIDGLWMMIYQGLYAFRHWTGIDVGDLLDQSKLNELHDLLLKKVKNEK